MQTILILLTLAGVVYLVARSHTTETRTMKEFDELDEAVEAIDRETTALGERVDGIIEELNDAKNDPAQVAAATGKLRDISARLKRMANTGDSGGTVVPTADDPVPGEDGGSAVGDSGQTGGGDTV